MEGKPVTLDSNNRVYCTEVDLHMMISLGRLTIMLRMTTMMMMRMTTMMIVDMSSRQR